MKILQTFLFLFITTSAVSQTEGVEQNFKNELRIDAFTLIVFPAINISYEHLYKPEMSYGVSLFMNLKSENGHYEKFAITPFFRFYFLSKKDFGTKGYFVEVFSKFVSGEDIFPFSNQKNSSYFDGSLGLAIGKKWLHKNGFTLENSFGIGRSLGFNKSSPDFVFRGSVSLGYQF